MRLRSRREKQWLPVIGAIVITAAMLTAACKAGGAAVPAGDVPNDLKAGEQLFNQHCAKCHGDRGMGTNVGPTFLSPIYLPNHHADESFQIAVLRGVQPHHWNYGPMAPIPDVKPAQVTEITKYVRWLQRQAGIK